MSIQASTYNNPEVLGPLGFELPQMPDIDLQENLKKSVAIGGSLVALGASAVGAVVFFGKTEKANAGVEVCTTPTGETPTPQISPKISGVDLMTFKPAFSTKLCVGYESTMTTYIKNIGSEPAINIKPSIGGRLDAMKTVVGLKINDTNIPILKQGASGPGDYCNFQSETDQNNKPTTSINCWAINQINLEPNESVKFEATLKPFKVISQDNTIKGPYLGVGVVNHPFKDSNFDNNLVRINLVAYDVNGDLPGQTANNTCKTTPKLTLKAPKVLKNGKGLLITSLTTTGTKINGRGNGASKYAKERVRAARVVVNTVAKTGKLPKDMRRIGNKIFIDIPTSGVAQGRNILDRVPFTSKAKLTRFNASFYAPLGTIASCGKLITTNSKRLTSTSR